MSSLAGSGVEKRPQQDRCHNCTVQEPMSVIERKLYIACCRTERLILNSEKGPKSDFEVIDVRPSLQTSQLLTLRVAKGINSIRTCPFCFF